MVLFSLYTAVAIEGEVVDFGGNSLIVVVKVVVIQSVELGVLQRNGSDDSVVAMNLSKVREGQTVL